MRGTITVLQLGVTELGVAATRPMLWYTVPGGTEKMLNDGEEYTVMWTEVKAGKGIS